MAARKTGDADPAADRRRMWSALGVLAILGVLAWFTIDANAALPVKQYSFGSMAFGSFSVKLRWLPELILALFGFRIVLANMRARFEEKYQDKGQE